VPSSSASTTRERLAAGETLVGTFLNLGSAVSAEVCARAGFDWLLVDLEHGAGTEAELIPALQAIAGRCAALVRVEANERPRFARALDSGADGVMVPRVDSAEDARHAVSFMRYPPAGVRGVASMNRGKGWGFDADPAEALCVIQIETRRAVEEAREIAATDGVDVLFVGPSDLGAALGTTELPLEDVIAAAHAERKAAGIMARTREDAERFIALGFSFVGLGSDSLFLAHGARAAAGT
jgi:2-dehydro-3-deoxyglucarate aldolase/4-hydroxy-2-oxoheptanedioate aldolase